MDFLQLVQVKSRKKKKKRSIDFIYNTIAPEQSFR